MSARPITDYNGPVACPSCGQHRPAGWTETFCVPCANTGSNIRLMGAEELRWTAAREEASGYAEVAERRRKLADALDAEAAKEVAPEWTTFEAQTRTLRIRARMLERGETIKAGDLYLSTTGCWDDVPEPCIGHPAPDPGRVKYARPVRETAKPEPTF